MVETEEENELEVKEKSKLQKVSGQRFFVHDIELGRPSNWSGHEREYKLIFKLKDKKMNLVKATMPYARKKDESEADVILRWHSKLVLVDGFLQDDHVILSRIRLAR